MTKIKRPHQRSHNLKRPLFLAALALIVICLGTFTLYNSNKNSNQEITSGDAAGPSPQDEKYINLDPATEDDQAEADRKKQEGIDREERSHDSTQIIKVTPVISFAGTRNGNIEVRAYVSEVYESTGKCTAIFSKEGESNITRTVEGLKDATYTRCDRIVIPVGEFGSKDGWHVSIEYESPTASGASESRSVGNL